MREIFAVRRRFAVGYVYKSCKVKEPKIFTFFVTKRGGVGWINSFPQIHFGL
jgi:hypothetical protein